MVQDKFETGMYIIDHDFTILNINDAMKELYPSVKVGDTCYKAIALQGCQCPICPLLQDDALFYNPLRKEWISANAAAIDYPDHGKCYSVQFHIRQNISNASHEDLQEDNLDEHIMELSGGNLDVCAIGSYCEPGAPLSYINSRMVKLMGYDNVEEMRTDVDGLVFNTIHPEDVQKVTSDLTSCALNGGTFETIYRLRRKGKDWLWVIAKGKRIQNVSGVNTLLCVVTDMNELLKRQMEFIRQKMQFDMVSENIPCGYHRCSVDDGFHLEFVSDNFLEILGYDNRADLLGKPFLDFVVPEDRELFMRHEPELVRNGKVELVYRIRRKDGTIRWVKDSTMRIRYNEKDTYQCILVDITEHVDGLNEARAQAEASSQAKSAFLFNASHDIRTPMNAIQGFANIIEENATDPAIVLDSVKKLKHSGDVLLTLMNDVLELSRIEQGKETVNRQPLDMQRHVENLYEMLAQEMQESEIAFRMENSMAHPLVFADELKLTRIAMNFLSNARKFTPSGGRVTFGIQESDYDGTSASYTLFVQDTGIGMSKEFQEHAFEQFERERTSTASGVTGSGLGLSITKKLADLLGGVCTIESELGQGTRMSCRVTLRLAQERDFKPDGDFPDEDLTGMRVLLVEDNDFNREIARYVFEGMGMVVEEAVNGRDCLNKLSDAEAGHFDVILMDVQMPIMDGYQATEEIRRHRNPSISHLPIIAMTANAFDEDRRRCLSVGMNGHIAKPMNPETIRKELAIVMMKGDSKR